MHAHPPATHTLHGHEATAAVMGRHPHGTWLDPQMKSSRIAQHLGVHAGVWGLTSVLADGEAHRPG